MREIRPRKGVTAGHHWIGASAAGAVFLLGAGYAIVLALGLHSLKSPQDPIGDPYFLLLELLIVLTAPLMVIVMAAVHAYATPDVKVCSLTALAFMILLAGLTCSIHFVILTVGRQIEATGSPWAPLLLSYRWPSVSYTLDILAWDFFFALSMLFAAPVFKQRGLETVLRILLIASGVLSLAGLIGVPLADMQVRMIGVLGYAVVSPFAFLLLSLVFGRAAAHFSRNHP